MRHLILLMVCVVAALTGCEDRSPAESGSSDGKLKVVCTTTMIADMAAAIAGPDAEVVGIMKTGEDPHVYDVRPRDAQLIAVAGLVLTNGLHLEATLEHVIENNASKAIVVRLAENAKIKPLQSAVTSGAADPHCWFNVEYFKAYAEGARDALVKADRAHADGYTQRAADYLRQLDELHAWVVERVSTIPRERRVMVTSHDAFQYFGEAYGVDVHGVVGISTEQAPRPQDIERLEALVRERKVKALFIETSVSATLNEIVRKVAASTGAKVGGTLYSDSLGEPGTPAGTYIGTIRHNVNTIVDALK